MLSLVPCALALNPGLLNIELDITVLIRSDAGIDLTGSLAASLETLLLSFLLLYFLELASVGVLRQVAALNDHLFVHVGGVRHRVWNGIVREGEFQVTIFERCGLFQVAGDLG